MSGGVLIPTQRIHEHTPRSPTANAVASSSRRTLSDEPTYPTPASSTSPPAHSRSTLGPPARTFPIEQTDQIDGLQAVGVSAEDVSADSKGKGRSRFTPTTPSSSSGPARFTCTQAPSECNKTFTKRAKLEEHILTHTGERPHSCPHCALSFARPTHLQAHVRTHLSEEDKPYACSKEACSKRFWTGQHLRRHEDGCGEGRYQCPLCPASFSLSHQLRSHHALDHSPPGTKPFPCTEPDCDKSFPTSQKLRQHAKMHDDSRYLCTHPSHPPEGVSFATWSSLRAHVSTAHPPECPYDECKGRPPFKSKKGLKAHLKVHKEREEDDRLLGEEEEEEPRGRGRKRTRAGRAGSSDGESDADDGVQRKKRRRSVSVAGKDWVCEVEGCGKAFKTSKARKTHHQTSHLHLRPFVCPHQASTGCTASYGHNHLLQRHLHKRHPDVSSASTQPSPPPRPILAAPATADQVIGFLTGSTYVSSRQIACPFHGRSGTLVSAGGHDEGCGYRFSRAYDLRRHLGKVHGVEVSEEEGRGMAERLRGEAD